MGPNPIPILLAARGLSCRALAARARTPLASVTRAVRGDNVRIETALAIAGALGLPAEEVFAHRVRPAPPPDDAAPTAAETPAQEGAA